MQNQYILNNIYKKFGALGDTFLRDGFQTNSLYVY